MSCDNSLAILARNTAIFALGRGPLLPFDINAASAAPRVPRITGRVR